MFALPKVMVVCLVTSALILAFRAVSAQHVISPEELPRGAMELAPGDVDKLFERSDLNRDQRLNADELPGDLRVRIGRLDVNADGYVSPDELRHYLAKKPHPPLDQGPVQTDHLIAVVDDFIVDIYHNGERVPDSKRTLLNEIHGATVEKIDVQLRKGDWLVFNVVNNRLRWNGARYFAVAGIKEGAGTAFTTDSNTGSWSRCDNPSQVSAFVADPQFLARQLVYGIDVPWDHGNALMNQYADGWKGTPVWGENRNTWIKFVMKNEG